MSEITEKIKQELLIRCEKSKEKDGYDFWNEHIKYVVENGIELAKKYGAEIAEQLLTELNYPKERIEQVKNCVLNHRGSKDRLRNTIEEQCVADADVIAHFDCIPSLFSLVYKEMNLSISDGKEYVRRKLERDYNKLSPKTRELLKDRYKNIVDVLFVN